MIVAILTESHVDDAIVRVLVDSVIGPTTPGDHLIKARPGGFNGVLGALGNSVRALNAWGVDGLVVAVDADHSPLVRRGDESEDVFRRRNRYALLRSIFDDRMRDARPRAGKPPLWCAIGIAVPTIEAWLLDPAEYPKVNEQTWIDGRREYDGAQLKRWAYGAEEAPAAIRTPRAMAGASRAAADIDGLVRRFPRGFGTLVTELRANAPADPPASR